MKRLITLLTTTAMLTASLHCTAAENTLYATRGEVCEMLLTAADDYNPEVKKTDILHGYDDGMLHEERSVTRAEALVMLKRAFGEIPEIRGTNKLLAIPAESFSDIPDWAEAELAPVFDAGIAAGTADGIFSPYDNVTKDQMRLFINRTYRVFGTNHKDDFYAAVNKDLLDEIELPDGYMEFGTLLDDQSVYDVTELIEDIATSQPEKNSKEEKIKNFYNNYIDTENRDKDGLGPLEEYIKTIDSVKTVSDLSEIRYDAELIANFFVGFSVAVDLADSSTYVAYFNTPDVYDKQYFLDPEFEAGFTEYYKQLGILCGETEEQAEKEAELCYRFEKVMAQEAITAADKRDISKLYNIYTLDELDDVFGTIDLKAVYDETNLKNKDKIIVTNESAVRLLSQMLTDSNIDMIKAVAKLEIVDAYSQYLSSDFIQVNDDFTEYLYGAEGETNVEYAAIQEIISYFPDYVGEAYAEKFNDPESVSGVREIVDEILGVYREKITNASWMSNEAKKTALEKLNTLQIKIGAPDKWDAYMDDAEILSYSEGGSLVENIFRINDAIVGYMYSLEGSKTDKTRWIMYPYETNACYYAQNNDITVTTAMLNTMAYDKEMRYEYNLGAIGTIIAHEITHAFDASGAQFDENGNLRSWWTDSDKEAFSVLCDDIEEYYYGLEGAPGIIVPADTTLTENMADLGALEIVTAAADKHENFDYTCMYEGYSYIWFTTMTRRMAQYLSINDNHSFPAIRVNRVLQSIDRFYEVYDITERDGMYVPPEKRVHFWS